MAFPRNPISLAADDQRAVSFLNAVVARRARRSKIRVDVQVGPNKYLSHVNSGAELSVEADKAGSSIFGDIMYLNIGNAGASVVNISGPLGIINIPLNVATSVRLTTTIATGGFGKQFWHVADSEGTAFVGLRYLNQTVSADWTLTGPIGMYSPTGSATGSKSDLEPLAACAGRFGLGKPLVRAGLRRLRRQRCDYDLSMVRRNRA